MIYPIEVEGTASANQRYTPVVEVRTVIKEVETIKSLREFESLGELRNWLDIQDVGVHAVFDKQGKVTYNCDAYSESLYRLAYADGYELWPVALDNWTHSENYCYIGNQVISINPQTKEIKHVANRD